MDGAVELIKAGQCKKKTKKRKKRKRSCPGQEKKNILKVKDK